MRIVWLTVASHRSRARTVAYWTAAAVLMVFGFLDLLAMGAPFLLTGVAMLLVGHWRDDRAILWPVLIGVWTLCAGFILAAPLGCTSSAGVAAPSSGHSVAGHTSCTNIIGIHYSGPTPYNPSLLPALLAGIGLGMVAAVIARLLFARVGRKGRSLLHEGS